MMGDWSVEVRSVRPLTIHGDLYYELQVVRASDSDGPRTTVRVPEHLLGAEPQVGDHLSVSFLAGQVTGATPVPSI